MPARNYADSHPAIRVSSKRFAVSPFQERYANDDTLYGVYAGRLYPLSIGDDPLEGYRRLREQAALFDVPERPVQVEGPDAERLLDLIFTRDVGRLPPGRAGYAIACDADGGILMDGVLIRFAVDRFWYVMADGEFLGWLRAHALDMDVTISDPGSWVAQIQGPTSLDVLADATDDGLPDPFPYFAMAQVRMGGQQVVVTRTGWSGELGFEVYTDREVDGPSLWDHLLAAGATHGLAVQGLGSLGIRRIEAGILDNGTDMDPTLTPWAAGLGRFVDFEKGPFIGRDALAHADRSPLLFGLSCPSATPVPGDPVLEDGTIVGHVTVGAWSPFLDRGIGYVRMYRAGEWVGRPVTLAEERATVVELPFYDAERAIPRGQPSGFGPEDRATPIGS
jgi:glycine cleavage system aminomethyltransferase T